MVTPEWQIGVLKGLILFSFRCCVFPELVGFHVSTNWKQLLSAANQVALARLDDSQFAFTHDIDDRLIRHAQHTGQMEVSVQNAIAIIVPNNQYLSAHLVSPSLVLTMFATIGDIDILQIVRDRLITLLPLGARKREDPIPIGRCRLCQSKTFLPKYTRLSCREISLANGSVLKAITSVKWG
jgi:hypothetical protein